MDMYDLLLRQTHAVHGVYVHSLSFTTSTPSRYSPVSFTSFLPSFFFVAFAQEPSEGGTVSEKLLTGEERGVIKAVGSVVLSGSVNEGSTPITIQVQKVSRNQPLSFFLSLSLSLSFFVTLFLSFFVTLFLSFTSFFFVCLGREFDGCQSDRCDVSRCSGNESASTENCR